MLTPLLLAVPLVLGQPPRQPHLQTATGFVFHDANGDSIRQPREAGLPSVRVSNGRQVTLTDTRGRYEIEVDDDDVIFVIKPRDWSVVHDENNLPKFYVVHKPAGSPRGLKYPGVAPTGPLPKSVDFALTRSPEPDRFKVVVFGDPQPRNIQEIDFLAHDIVEEVVGTDAVMGVSLGDIVFDDMSLYPDYNAVVRRIGVPWHNVHGNHDMNYDVKSDELADETWERVYGPPTYSFDCGPVHFVVIDDVMYDGHIEKGKYHCELGRHLEFIASDLAHVDTDALVVLLMHIPLTGAEDRERLFDLLEPFPHTFSLAAHWHTQEHIFFDSSQGWDGAKPHHHLVHATACGSWWSGAPDELGIPHATMACGAPNGYSIVTFDGNTYSVRFKAARKPAAYQMQIYLPDAVARADIENTLVKVNVFAGSERSRVRMRVDGGPWAPMRHERVADPYLALLKAQEESDSPPPGRATPRLRESPHIWVAPMPTGLGAGVHAFEIESVDMFDQRDVDRRLVRVLP